MIRTIEEKYSLLGIDNAPGQESLRKEEKLDLRGDVLPGVPVDFSHGDIDAHRPAPGSIEAFDEGFAEGQAQAYTPYRGRKEILELTAGRLAAFTGASVDPEREIILTPGTQGALFLAMGASVMPGDRVAFVEPDYFANRKMIEFLGGETVPVPMYYDNTNHGSGIDLKALESAFAEGAKLFLFSNPNNPTGCVYSFDEICRIASMARKYGASLIVDELYSRQIYDGEVYTHLRAQEDIPENLITIIGPSKTESLSGFRLGTAIGSASVIDRMEKLLAIMSLRCSGYNQAVFRTWFNEPVEWLNKRIAEHQNIRDDLMKIINDTPGVSARVPKGGSYLFVKIPDLEVPLHQFARIVRNLAGVSVTPGTEFGPQFIHEFRINFSQDKDAAADAMRRLFSVMERYRK